MLGIETAGQSGSQTGHDARLIGFIDTRTFRDRVLQRRDLIADKTGSIAPTATEQPLVRADNELLTDIRDTLHRIEKSLSR